MIFKELKNKTWVDWVKIIVAIDIAIRGFGLIIGIQALSLNFFVAYLMGPFGFLSRLFFGVMYVFVAMLIFKRVFPQALAKEEQTEAKKMNEEIIDTTNAVKKSSKKIIEKIIKITEKTQDRVDGLLDRGANFAKKRKKEAGDEIKELMKD